MTMTRTDRGSTRTACGLGGDAAPIPGVFTEDGNGRFELSALATPLRGDVPGVSAGALRHARRELVGRALAELLDSVGHAALAVRCAMADFVRSGKR
jgi:hypothetical protein